MNTKVRVAEDRLKTSAPISAGASADSEFIRIADVEKLFGIKRGLTYRWLKEGLIKGACIRKKGASTGIRLIHADSVRSFLLSNLEGGIHESL